MFFFFEMKTNLKDQYITRWDPLYSYKYHLIMLKTAKILFFLLKKLLLLTDLCGWKKLEELDLNKHYPDKILFVY